ncbi:MAG TPA: 2-oxoacid:acceptor oxidoreductase family protein, partial [Bacillota bacterium]|nr:2-oxoacid:acceptor oxidoreductase family protein [Bacillota bacterium]
SLYIPNFGIEQRGGVSLAMVQLSAAPIGAPKFQIADLIVALSPRSYRRCFQHLGPETMVLYDSSLMEPPRVEDQVVGLQAYDTIAPEAFAERVGRHPRREESPPPGRRLIAIPASDLARKHLHPRVFNMIVLGAIGAITGMVELELIKEALAKKLDRRFAKDPDLKENNFKALELGWEKGTQAAKEAAVGAEV